MKASIEVKDNVILRCFKGDVYFEDIIDSWNEIFSRYESLTSYQGIVTDFLDATMHHEDKNLNLLVEYLMGYLDRMAGMKIAIVMDTPQVTNTIIMGHKIKQLQIRPFSTREGALRWVTL